MNEGSDAGRTSPHTGWAVVSLLTLSMLSCAALAQKADRPDVKVGDQWRFSKTADNRSPALNFAWIITSVTPEGIRGTEDGEPLLLTPDMNVLDSPRRKSPDQKLLVFPLEIGKSWPTEFEFWLKDTGSKGHAKGGATVLSYEKVRVPAGEFDAFRLVMTTTAKGRAAAGFDYTASTSYTYWYAPAARTIVRQDILDSARGPYKIELIEFKLQP